MIIPIIIFIFILLIILLYIVKKESMASMGQDLLGFPGRYVEAIKTGFANIGNIIYPATLESCQPGYTDFGLTCTKGCGGFWNESWGATLCNGPQRRPTYAPWWLGGWRSGWDDCYSTYLPSCTNDGKGGHPAHTYGKRLLCRGNDVEVLGICGPRL